MAFNVKTYLIEEEKEEEEDGEDLAQRIATFKEAGLDTLVATLEEPSDTSVPFRRLSKKEHRVFELSHFYKSSVSSFSQMIPIKVASVLALCKEHQYFKNVYIHCDVEVHNAMLSSYVALGTTKEGEEYIIAQWSATDLKQYPQLEEEAFSVAKKRLQEKITKEIHDKESDLQEVDKIAERYVRGEWTSYWL